MIYGDDNIHDALEKVATAADIITPQSLKESDMVPDRVRRALAGAYLGATIGGGASLLTSTLTRSPNKVVRALKDAAVVGGVGSLLGQKLGLMKHRDAGRPGLKRATRGPRKGKWVFARKNENA